MGTEPAVSDFNGRIQEIVSAFEKYPAGDLNTRMIVRQVLAAERADGFREGYAEGIGDACAAEHSEQRRADREAAGTEKT
jgi:hypothetical protein